MICSSDCSLDTQPGRYPVKPTYVLNVYSWNYLAISPHLAARFQTRTGRVFGGWSQLACNIINQSRYSLCPKSTTQWRHCKWPRSVYAFLKGFFSYVLFVKTQHSGRQPGIRNDVISGGSSSGNGCFTRLVLHLLYFHVFSVLCMCILTTEDERICYAMTILKNIWGFLCTFLLHIY